MTSHSQPLAIAVTGASGFLGGAVLRTLLAGGHTVRALVRRDGALAPGVETVTGTLADGVALARLVDGADVVVHLAGAVVARREADFFAVNGAGTANVAAAAIAAGCPRLLAVSSLAAREPQLSAYAASKRAGETALEAARANIAIAVVRPPAVYGPGDRMTLPLIRQLARRRPLLPLAAGQRLSLLYVDDFAALISALLTEPRCPAEPIEPDDGRAGGYTWPDLAAIAAATFGHPVRPLFLPQGVIAAAAAAVRVLSRVAGIAPALSPGKVHELYHHDWVCRPIPTAAIGGWRPAVPFADGLARTVTWYQRMGWLGGRPPFLLSTTGIAK
jgi:nucleoside-diphosphate-sugar epimerase